MSTDALGARRINIDRFYSNLSIGIAPDQELVGDQLFPVLMTELSSEKIKKYGDEAWRLQEDLVGDFSIPNRIDTKMDKITVEVDGHALESPVSDRHQKESLSGPAQLNLEQQNMYTLKQQMLLRREKYQADLARTAAAYGANTTDPNGLGVGWDTDDIFDQLVKFIETEIPEGSGKRPNLLLMGQPVWAAVLKNVAIKDRVFGTIAKQPYVTPELIGSILGLKVVVGRTISRSELGAVTYLWGKDAILAYVPPTTGTQIPAFGYTVEQSVFGGSSEAVNRIRDEHMGASGGWYLKRSHFYTPVITFPASGHLFTNAVA